MCWKCVKFELLLLSLFICVIQYHPNHPSIILLVCLASPTGRNCNVMDTVIVFTLVYDVLEMDIYKSIET